MSALAIVLSFVGGLATGVVGCAVTAYRVVTKPKNIERMRRAMYAGAAAGGAAARAMNDEAPRAGGLQ